MEIKTPKLIKIIGLKYKDNNSKYKQKLAIYECPICKKEYEANYYNIKHGKSTKCKSCATRIKNTTHGDRYTRLYKIWKGIKSRCLNKNDTCYGHYGKIGIKICNEWKEEWLTFKRWALNNGYNDKLSIDRINNYDGYNPNNCRWANSNTQSANKRIKSGGSSIFVGVSIKKSETMYQSRISINNKQIVLGRFKDPIVAAYTRDLYIDRNNLPHTKNFKRIAL